MSITYHLSFNITSNFYLQLILFFVCFFNAEPPLQTPFETEPPNESLNESLTEPDSSTSIVPDQLGAIVKTELMMDGCPVTREILKKNESNPIKVYICIEQNPSLTSKTPKKLYIVSDSPHANAACKSEEIFQAVCGIPRWLFNITLNELDDVLSKSTILSNADQLVFYFMKLKVVIFQSLK